MEFSGTYRQFQNLGLDIDETLLDDPEDIDDDDDRQLGDLLPTIKEEEVDEDSVLSSIRRKSLLKYARRESRLRSTRNSSEIIHTKSAREVNGISNQNNKIIIFYSFIPER